jgi:hypothetical protein
MDPNKLDEKKKELLVAEMAEENILVASWIDDMSIPQRELESRKLFYMNESLLLNQDLRDHFSNKNAKKFYS